MEGGVGAEEDIWERRSQMASNLLAKSECFSVRVAMASSRRSVVVRRVPCSAMEDGRSDQCYGVNREGECKPCFEVKVPPKDQVYSKG